MSLDDVSSVAFVQGCGIKRSTALRSPRFQQLRDESWQIKYGDGLRAAEIALLGEHLADRAFRNLPKMIRDTSPRWKQMSSAEQRIFADDLVAMLQHKAWPDRKGATRKTQEGLVNALPHAYGSWTRGKHQPNCLGVAQMLVGFARRTGAAFYLGTVVQQYDMALVQMQYRLMIGIQDIIEPLRHEAEVERQYQILDKYRIRCLSALAAFRRLQAHHVLVIRSKRGWRVIDPYLATTYLLHDTREVTSLVRDLRRAPDMHVRISEDWPPPMDDYWRGAKALVAAVEFCRVHVAKGVGSSVTLRAAAEFAAWTASVDGDEAEVGYGDRIAELIKRRRLSYFARLYGDFYAIGLLPKKYLRPYIDGDASDRDALRIRLEKLQSSRPVYARASITRVVGAAVNNCLRGIDGLSMQPGFRRHPVLELAHPTYMLGMATLNYVAVHLPVPVPDLVKYHSSQWILYDTLEAVSTNGTETHKRVVTDRLRRIGEYGSSGVLQGLVPYLEED